jgi:hypothetical protein
VFCWGMAGRADATMTDTKANFVHKSGIGAFLLTLFCSSRRRRTRTLPSRCGRARALHQNGDTPMTKDSKRLVLSGDIQLVLLYEHDDSHQPYETAGRVQQIR